MTDRFKDKELQKPLSFKEKILAELATASRERKQAKEEVTTITENSVQSATPVSEEASAASNAVTSVSDNIIPMPETTSSKVTELASKHTEEISEEISTDLQVEKVVPLETVEGLRATESEVTETEFVLEIEEVEEAPVTELVEPLVEESEELQKSAFEPEEKVQNEATVDELSLVETLVFQGRLVTERDLEQVQLADPTLESSQVVEEVDLETATTITGPELKPISVIEAPQLETDLEAVQPTQVVETLDEPAPEQVLPTADMAAGTLPADAKVPKIERGNDIRKRRNRVATKISRIVASVIILLLLAAAALTFFYVSSAIGPVDKKSTEYVQVEIPVGSGNKLIGQILKENKVIKDANVFNFYTKFKNYSNFQSGYYNFQKNMSLDDIAKYLQEGGTAEPQRPSLGKVTIPEGYTLKQMAKAIALNSNTEDATDKSKFSSEEFLALVKDEKFIAKMVDKYPGLLGSLPDSSEAINRLEGYLFPATYDYYEETTLEEFVEQMIAAMDANLSPYYSQIANMGMSVNDILTMASLVEKEGATDDDREMIASVFYNRLNTGMPLQSNIAILYAMDKLGEKTTLAEDAGIDTNIDSPYNIYQNPGLMPGPVDSPSLSAILATIKPASTDYLYFVADVTTGAVYFSETFEQHSAYVEEHVNSKLN